MPLFLNLKLFKFFFFHSNLLPSYYQDFCVSKRLFFPINEMSQKGIDINIEMIIQRILFQVEIIRWKLNELPIQRTQSLGLLWTSIDMIPPYIPRCSDRNSFQIWLNKLLGINFLQNSMVFCLLIFFKQDTQSIFWNFDSIQSCRVHWCLFPRHFLTYCIFFCHPTKNPLI